MKKTYILGWLYRRSRYICLMLSFYVSVFTVLFFFKETTLSYLYHKGQVATSMGLARFKLPPYPTNHSGATSMETSNKPPAHFNITKVVKKFKFLSLREFTYPLEIDLVKLVNDKIGFGTAINAAPINRHNFQYLHKPEDCISPGNDSTVTLLVLVKSGAGNVDLRSGIRETWGKHPPEFVRIVFLLAKTDAQTQKLIDQESDKYSDIIQEDFVDIYINNTYKTIMGYNWGVTYCSTASFFFFVDDDHYVLLDNVYAYVKSKKRNDDVLTGFLLPHSTPYRDIKSKWYVAPEDYPFDRWQPYLAGGAYLVSFSVAQKFQVAFPYVKYLGIDDSYLGIVAKKLSIRPTHNPKFSHRTTSLVTKSTKLRRDIFASHGFKKADDMKIVWNLLHGIVDNSTRHGNSPSVH